MLNSIFINLAYRFQVFLWDRIERVSHGRDRLCELLMKRAEALGMIAYKRPPTYAGQENIPDWKFYRPSEYGDWLFSPWEGWGDFSDYLAAATPHSAIAVERLYVLFTLARQTLRVEGDYVECGVWRGGSAILLAQLLHRHADDGTQARQLYLFDTFEGMPAADARRDTYYKGGEFADTNLEAVEERIPFKDFVVFKKGLIPDTFMGLETLRVAFAHVDVDIYRSVKACCEFLYPRLAQGGVMVFDDYGWSTCPGAKAAVDEFFAPRSVKPLVLQNGQAIIFKSIPEG